MRVIVEGPSKSGKTRLIALFQKALSKTKSTDWPKTMGTVDFVETRILKGDR